MSREVEVRRRCDMCGEFMTEGEGVSLPGSPWRGNTPGTYDVCDLDAGKPIRELAERVRDRG